MDCYVHVGDLGGLLKVCLNRNLFTGYVFAFLQLFELFFGVLIRIGEHEGRYKPLLEVVDQPHRDFTHVVDLKWRYLHEELASKLLFF